MVIVGLFLLTVIAGMVALILYGPGAMREYRLRSDFSQYQAAAEFFRGRIGDYKGVCSELVLANDVRCKATTEAFLVTYKVGPDSFYCTDSSGFVGKVAVLPPDVLRCQ